MSRLRVSPTTAPPTLAPVMMAALAVVPPSYTLVRVPPMPAADVSRAGVMPAGTDAEVVVKSESPLTLPLAPVIAPSVRPDTVT